MLKNKKTFDFSILTKIRVKHLPQYQVWHNFMSKYIDDSIIFRNLTKKEKTQIPEDSVYECIFVANLVIYNTLITILQKHDFSKITEPLFESAVLSLSYPERELITEVSSNYASLETNYYSLCEELYRKITPKGFRKVLGEYFTPIDFADKIIEDIPTPQLNDIWMDNSSGYGSFLFSFLNKYGVENYKKFICIEVNPLSCFITRAVLCLSYLKDDTKVQNANIFWGDSLLNENYHFENQTISVVGDFSQFYNKIDRITGNPPWVAWKSLSSTYQNLIGDSWRSMGLFKTSVSRKNMGACNDDISSYFTYFSIENFLNDSGKLRFIINSSLFLNNTSGSEFRKFFIEKSNTHFCVEWINDYSKCKLIPGITIPYCVFEATKNKKTNFPIQYNKKVGSLSLGEESENICFANTMPESKYNQFQVVCKSSKNSKNIVGKNSYRARAGVCTWLNGAYWVSKNSQSGEMTSVENLGNSGKKKVQISQVNVKSDLVFDLLQARNIENFYQPKNSIGIITPQQSNNLAKPIKEDELEDISPELLEYFLGLKTDLLGRSGYKKFLKGQPFYSLYNIGEYTKAPVKLGWKFIGKEFRTFIIPNAERILPDLNVMYIPFENIDEAYYVMAILNSSLVSQYIETSSNWTMSAGVIKNINIKKFNPRNSLHEDLSSGQKLLIENNEKFNAELLVNSIW
ncbi:MAG: SAM-dependent methyltransferase [Lactobacillales bacterium]|jgi:hypothetical protein|nr:SAM-dependent methyltransferase [Lactobacillales bacterium]